MRPRFNSWAGSPPGEGIGCPLQYSWASPVAQMVKNLPAVRETWLGSIPGLERFPGGGHGNPLQYSCLENPMDKGAWRAPVCGVANSQTQLKRLSIHTHILQLKEQKRGDSLVVQWLRLCAPNARDPSLIPGQGTRSHMLQPRVPMPQLKILHVATKTQCSQIN